MAKSKRSKVKMAYRAMRRAALQTRLDARQQAQADKVYSAIGLPMPVPNEDDAHQKAMSRSHNGCDIISTFVPTPKGPTLNVVHGPLANKDGLMMDAPVVGFPVIGAGERARRAAGRADSMQVDGGESGKKKRHNKQRKKRGIIDVNEEGKEGSGGGGETPYFYPRKTYRESAIKKQRKQKVARAREEAKRLAKIPMDVQVE